MTEGWLICGKLWERGRKPPFHFIGWDYFFLKPRMSIVKNVWKKLDALLLAAGLLA